MLRSKTSSTKTTKNTTGLALNTSPIMWRRNFSITPFCTAHPSSEMAAKRQWAICPRSGKSGHKSRSKHKAEVANPSFVGYTKTREMVWDFYSLMMFR